MFTEISNLNTKLLWPNFRFKDACTSRLKTRLRLCQGRVCVSCHRMLQCFCRGCFRVPSEDVSTSQSGTFLRLNYVMNRTYSLSYLRLLGRSSWKDAFTSGTHLRLGPDCWHGTKRMRVNRKSDPLCGFELWPNMWSWPWIFKFGIEATELQWSSLHHVCVAISPRTYQCPQRLSSHMHSISQNIWIHSGKAHRKGMTVFLL